MRSFFNKCSHCSGKELFSNKKAKVRRLSSLYETNFGR